MIDGKRVLAEVRMLLGEIEREERGMTLEELKRFKRVKLPPWVRDAVEAVLRGYVPRAEAIKHQEAPTEILYEYERLNFEIDDAIETVCFGYGERVVSCLRADLIDGVGWQKSVISGTFGERTFYSVKRTCMAYIASKLGFF